MTTVLYKFTRQVAVTELIKSLCVQTALNKILLGHPVASFDGVFPREYIQIG